MTDFFIIAIRNHRTWGTVFTPYIAQSVKDKAFYSIKTQLSNGEIKRSDFDFSEKEAKLIKILDSYSDVNLMKLFDKKSNNIQSFLSNVDKEKIEQLIRPYIEQKISKALAIMHELNGEGKLRMYYKKDDLTTLHSSDKITLLKESSQAVFNFKRTPDDLKYFLTVKKTDGELELNKRRGIVLINEPCVAMIDNELVWFEDIDFKKLLPFFSKEFVKIPKTTEAKYFDTFIYNAIRKFDVRATGFEIKRIKEKPRMEISLVADIYNRILFELLFTYHDALFKFGEKKQYVVYKEHTETEYAFRKICRDNDFEAKVVADLEANGLYKVTESLLGVEDRDLKSHYSAVSWINEKSEVLEQLGIEANPELSGKRYFINDIGLNVTLKEESDWFDIYGLVNFGEFQIPFVELRKYIVNGIKEFALPNGETAILPDEWFAEYHELMLMGEEAGGHLKLKKYHFGAISSKIQGINTERLNKLKKLNSSEIQRINPPEGLQATLRDYQHLGYSWMAHLQTCGFGGCLADDMGLGKTLQTLTVLQKSIKPRYETPLDDDDVFDDGTGGTIIQLDIFGKPVEKPEAKFPETKKQADYSAATLIVMPVSLIHNWENEIRKFTPQLSVTKYLGAGRSKSLTRMDSFDIVLTSYGIVRNDIDFLKKYKFYYLILDESQYIKNPNSKVYHAVNELNAQHKLVLTGTPIENSLTDLWTQLNFLNRGLLGNLTFFKNEFITPIERNKDDVKQRKLQTLIQPFLLRRTKSEVAKDLPPITEQIVYCNMSDAQESFYEEEKSKVRNRIFESIEVDGIEKSSMLVLQGLTRLRQIANHPTLVSEDYPEDSGKYNLVVDHVENLIAESHKVLIYSSFVKHLQLFENLFAERGYNYVKLTGETRDRKSVVEKFQSDESTRLFLISLKAGGVGLNLTAADYVFLLDPWWNPAAENQAINRAHRIGQNKNVFVYRFISKDTIEEKIVRLQEKKSALAELFINSNNPFKAMSVESIEELLG